MLSTTGYDKGRGRCTGGKLNTPKTISMVERIMITPGTITVLTGLGRIRTFGNNRTMYLNGPFTSALSYRAMETDFGIIPYPKYDEAQQNYLTMSDALIQYGNSNDNQY